MESNKKKMKFVKMTYQISQMAKLPHHLSYNSELSLSTITNEI